MVSRLWVLLLIAGITIGEGKAQGSPDKLVQTKYSKKAVRLVLKQRGKRVGSGTSLALLHLYESKSKARNALKFSLSKKTLPYISVGDELIFSGTYKNTNVEDPSQSVYEYAGPMHHAIVVGKKDANTLIIAHQNVNEANTRTARVVLSELKVEDPARFENINVYRLFPKKKNFKPAKLLATGSDVYEINSVNLEKTSYLAGTNFTQ